MAAARTRRLRLYPATSSPVVRHPLLLVSAAHSLEEIAPGRIPLTVAPGCLAVGAIGQPRAPRPAGCEAFGLFGPPEHCRDRLLQARQEAGVDHVFAFPAHTLEGGGDLPLREVEAFARVIRPALNGLRGECA